MRRSSSSRPAGDAILQVTLFLPRLYAMNHDGRSSGPAFDSRNGSPTPGISILMTSAPRSASSIPAYGPLMNEPSSTTRTPASGPVIGPMIRQMVRRADRLRDRTYVSGVVGVPYQGYEKLRAVRDRGILTISFDNPPVNVYDRGITGALGRAIDRFERVRAALCRRRCSG